MDVQAEAKKPVERQIETSVHDPGEKKYNQTTAQPDNKTNKIGIKYNSASDTAAPSSKGRVTALDRWLIKQVAEMTGHPPLKVVLWGV